MHFLQFTIIINKLLLIIIINKLFFYMRIHTILTTSRKHQ